jgi:hypothetical protein
MPNQTRSQHAQPLSSPLAPCMRATPKRAGRRRTQRSPADVLVPISTPPCFDGTAPAHCTGRQRPRAIPPRRSRSCPCHRPIRRGGPGVGPRWTVVPASGSLSTDKYEGLGWWGKWEGPEAGSVARVNVRVARFARVQHAHLGMQASSSKVGRRTTSYRKYRHRPRARRRG